MPIASLAADVAPATENAKQSGADIKLPAPPAGKGQVVFFRKGGLSGSAVACTVHENNKKVSSLGGGRYFILVTEPGRHEFAVKTEATDKLALEIEADETQFASCVIKMGFMVGRPDIKPATDADFRSMKSLRLVDADDMGEGALRPEQVSAGVPASVPAVTPAAAPAAPVTN
ncbi:MAG: hypothetical protein B7Z39_02535 [Novosphingobium sp. 12-64-8]|nr:MAG: hypothetical protein B7Z39_02535 [Novosphingobium sp. 12-64-8]